MEPSRGKYIAVWAIAGASAFIISYGIGLLLRFVIQTYAPNAYELQILSFMLSTIASCFLGYFVVIAIYKNFSLLNYKKVVYWLWLIYFAVGIIYSLRVLALLNFDAAAVALLSGFVFTASVCQKLDQMESMKV